MQIVRLLMVLDIRPRKNEIRRFVRGGSDSKKDIFKGKTGFVGQ
jgi:hypothetical protein